MSSLPPLHTRGQLLTNGHTPRGRTVLLNKNDLALLPVQDRENVHAWSQ